MIEERKWQAPPCGGRWCYKDGEWVAWVYTSDTPMFNWIGEVLRHTPEGLERVGRPHIGLNNSLRDMQHSMVQELEGCKEGAREHASK